MMLLEALIIFGGLLVTVGGPIALVFALAYGIAVLDYILRKGNKP